MSETNLLDGEELIAETATRSIGDVNWLSKTNIVLALLTCGAWYAVPALRALASQTEYTITDERIIEESGLLTSSSKQTNFEKIVGDIKTSQTTTQAASGVGDVTFTVQKTQEVSGEVGNIGERNTSKRQQNVNRQTITLSSVKDYDEVAQKIRRLQHD